MDNLKRTLLVVDDEEDICEMLADTAKQDGYNVLIAKDGTEALAILRAEKVDAVLTDLMMPNMNGSELIMRTRALGRATPFVLVSGVNDDSAVIGAFRSGACDFPPKPFTTEILRSVVNRVLDIGARLNTVDSLLDRLAEENTEIADQVDKIRRQQQ